MLAGRQTGGPELPAYRLYRLDGAGKITSADWIEADCDSAAVTEAKQQVEGASYELWARNRLVERHSPNAK